MRLVRIFVNCFLVALGCFVAPFFLPIAVIRVFFLSRYRQDPSRPWLVGEKWFWEVSPENSVLRAIPFGFGSVPANETIH